MKLTSLISDDNELDDYLSVNNNRKKVEVCKDDSSVQTLYAGEEAKGFDVSSGSEWIYPTNLPIREYQKNIVSNALFKNTLVCLPTGLGKTFIAAVVMYNYHRWYPKNIVVFMAHSKPLVTQQVNACCTIMGIPSSAIAELNGNMLHSNRKKKWESKKIFFLTPQVFNNDLARGNVKPESIRCLVIDEAHKATGNQAYCQVIRSIKPFNSNFRVLALSATPGDDMNMVREVIQNLMISHLELRNEEDPDIIPYLHQKVIETVVVKLDSKILEVKERFLRAVDKYVKPLIKNKILPQSFSAINPFSLVLKQRQFVQDPNVGPDLRGLMLSNFSVAISLFHALEELTVHGLRSFLSKLKCLQTGEGSTNKAHYRIANDEDIRSLIENVEEYLGPDQNVSFDPNGSLTRIFDEIDAIDAAGKMTYSHPKFAALEGIIRKHFEEREGSTRVIVFCKSRQCTGEICNFLARFKPLVKPMIFIGQSQTSSGIVAKGFNQSVQLSVMRKFREGVYNTLVATCVAEEGLDIGEVDLIVNFDSGKNSNTQVQRSGRTGRKRNGRVVNLVTEGKEHQNYNISVSKGKRMRKRLVGSAETLPFYSEAPRLIPKHLHPVCQEMFFTHVAPEEGATTKREAKKRSRKQKANDGGDAKRLKENVKDIFEKSEILWSTIRNHERKTLGAVNKNKTEKGIEGMRPRESVSNDNDDDDDDVVVIDEPRRENEPWELITDSDFDEEERMLLTGFFKSAASRSSFKVADLLKGLSWRKVEKAVTRESNLIESLRAFEGRTLEPSDVEFLSADELRRCVNESRRKLPEMTLDGSRKKSSTLEEEIDLENFLEGIEGDLLLSRGNVVSSTPLRDISNRATRKGVVGEASSVEKGNSEFQLPEGFFDSTRKDERSDGSRVQGTTLISITQALDMVERLTTETTEKRPSSPSSPILFVSQRVKGSRGRSQAVSDSTTSAFGGRSSRKCLTFEKEKIANVRPVELDVFDGGGDLFAEAEIALQNEKLQTEGGVSDEDTVEYDVPEASPGGSSAATAIPEEVSRFNESKKDKSEGNSSRKPKMAVVRPIGFENAPLTTIDGGSGKDFSCDFSLFDDDDDFAEVLAKEEAPVNALEGTSNDRDVGERRSAPQVVGDFPEEEEFSDGALEAIKAVEEYERKAAMAKKEEIVDVTSSDESDEFFVPVKFRTRKDGTRNDEEGRGGGVGSEFVDAEAEISGTHPFSSDEENTTGLDEYDSSFVDERDVLTQAPDVDMTAKYLESMKSPRCGTFKIPKPREVLDVDVFTQVPIERDSDYELDSFCVKEFEEEEEEEVGKGREVSALELAEIILEDKRRGKRKRRKSESSLGKKKKKTFKRVMRISSSSSSCEEEAEVSKKAEEPRKKCDDAESEKPIVFIASRQIASAPEITTALRARWNVGVHVRSSPEADYIVGWRVGICRILLSDFASGSPAARNSLKEVINRLTTNFREPVVIVEDDKEKGLPRTIGAGSVLWSKHSYRTLSNIVRNDIKMLFSRGKDDTARIIVRLSMEEKRKGREIRWNASDGCSDTERRLKFFGSLPGVNVANAARICRKYPSLASFASNVRSVNDVMREFCLGRDAATSIYKLLFDAPDSSRR